MSDFSMYNYSDPTYGLGDDGSGIDLSGLTGLVDYGGGGLGADLSGLGGLIPQMAPSYSTTKSMFGRQLPMGQDQINKQWTGLKNMLAVIKDPMFNQWVSAATGADTFDYGLFGGNSSYAGLGGGGQSYVDPDTGEIVTIGGGSGGGGGGGSGGYQSVFTTLNSDAAARSTDPVMRGIVAAIQQGQDPGTIKMGLLSKEPDQRKLDVYNQTVDDVFKEQSGWVKNQLLGQQAGMVTGDPKNPLLAAYEKTGMPNPATTYSADNLPADVEAPLQQFLSSNPFLQAEASRSDDYQRQLDNLTKGRNLDGSAIAATPDAPTYQPQSNWGPPTMRDGKLVRPDATGTPAITTAEVGKTFTPEGGDIGNANDPNTAAMREAIQNKMRSQGAGPKTGADSIKASVAPQLLQQMGAGLNHQVQRPGVGGTWNTNQAGADRATMQKRLTDIVASNRQFQQNVQNDVRNALARDVQRSGRTPQSDRMQAQINFIRAMGIGI